MAATANSSSSIRLLHRPGQMLNHLVVVLPSGSTGQTGVIKGGADLETEFPRVQSDKRDGWVVDWPAKKSDAGSQPTAESTAGSQGAGPTRTGQGDVCTGGAGSQVTRYTDLGADAGCRNRSSGRLTGLRVLAAA